MHHKEEFSKLVTKKNNMFTVIRLKSLQTDSHCKHEVKPSASWKVGKRYKAPKCSFKGCFIKRNIRVQEVSELETGCCAVKSYFRTKAPPHSG